MVASVATTAASGRAEPSADGRQGRERTIRTEEVAISVSEIDISVSEIDLSVSEIDISVSEIDLSVSEIGISVSEIRISVSEIDISVSEIRISVSEIDISGSEIDISGSEIVISVSEIVISVSEIGISVLEIVISVLEIVIHPRQLVPNSDVVTIGRSMVAAIYGLRQRRTVLAPRNRCSYLRRLHKPSDAKPDRSRTNQNNHAIEQEQKCDAGKYPPLNGLRLCEKRRSGPMLAMACL